LAIFHLLVIPLLSSLCLLCLFLSLYPGAHRPLLSFPTRRSSDLCCDLIPRKLLRAVKLVVALQIDPELRRGPEVLRDLGGVLDQDRKSTRLNSSHVSISYAVFCLKKKRAVS